MANTDLTPRDDRNPAMRNFIQATSDVLQNHEERISDLEDTTDIVVERLDAVETNRQITIEKTSGGKGGRGAGSAFIRGATLGLYDPE